MSKYIDAIVRKLRREPVRVRLYAVTAAVFAVLAYHGVVEADAVPTYLAAAAAILVVERTRAQVVPAVKATRKRRRAS